MSPLERRPFLDIMGTIPSVVTVVTTLDDDRRPHGLTVSAVCSVSAEPPMLLVCIDRRSRTLASLRLSGRFAVNFLRGDRAELGQRFASSLVDRFEGVEWRGASSGAPVLYADCLSFAACRTVEEIGAGDHVILIGLVEEGSPPPPFSRPLMYYRRRYGAWPIEVAEDDVNHGGQNGHDGAIAVSDRLPADLRLGRG
jgi:flavin reductase (DIM6/NTAB) family NADH-FMN oxidoreductase RutF